MEMMRNTARSNSSMCFRLLFLLASWKFDTSANLVYDGYCPVVFLLPFTYPSNSFFKKAYFPSQEVTPEEGTAEELFGNLAAALMAIDHVNNRNGHIVKELSTQSFHECDISIDQYFTMDSLADDLLLQLPSVLQGPNEGSPGYQQTQDTDAEEDLQITSRRVNDTSVCAVIGPFRSNVAEEVAKSASLLNIPLVSPLAASQNLEDHQLFGSMTVEASARSKVLMEYLNNLERDFIAILSSDDRVGTEFSKGMESRCEELGRTCKSFKFHAADSDGFQSMHLALELIRDSAFTTIVCSLDVNAEHDYLAEYSTELGLQGEEFMWIIHCTESFLPIFNFVRAGRNSPVQEFFNGMGYFTVGVPSDNSEVFEESLRHLDKVFLNRVLESIPASERNKYGTLVKTNYSQHKYFGVTTDAAFVYDTVVATALGACEVRKKLLDVNDHDNDFDAHSDHVIEIFGGSFVGASGNVRFDRARRSRDADTLEFAITNVRPRLVGDESVGLFYRYDMVTTSKYSAGAWVDEAEFIYADGSASAPFPLRLVDVEVIYLSRGLRIGTFCLAMIGVVVCFFVAVMVWVYREKEEIRISQPKFLYSIIFECFVRCARVLLVLVDPRSPFVKDIADEMCFAKLYLSYLTLIVRYTALMIKLRMLKIALSSSREPIFSLSLLGPLVLIPALSTAALTASAVMYPPHQAEAVVSRDVYGFPTVTFEYCRLTGSNERNLFQHTPILQVFVVCHVCILIALVRMSWYAKNEKIAFNEARGIYLSICVDAAFLAFFVLFGLLHPVVTTAAGAPRAELNYFLSYIVPVFAVGMSNIIFIVLPKLHSSTPIIPEVVSIESSFISDISNITKNSVPFVEQTFGTAGGEEND